MKCLKKKSLISTGLYRWYPIGILPHDLYSYLPATEPFGPFGLVVNVLDLVHGIRPVDGYGHLLLDVNGVWFVHRIRHGLFHGVRDRLDYGHWIRHTHCYRCRYTDGNGPVHGHGHGPVDLHVLRDHLFWSVSLTVGSSVSEISEQINFTQFPRSFAGFSDNLVHFYQNK